MAEPQPKFSLYTSKDGRTSKRFPALEWLSPCVLTYRTGASRCYVITAAAAMTITYFGEKPGSASAVKMFCSIFMKGFVMLLLESVIAGHRYGVEDQVLDSIEETLTEGSSIKAMINGLLARGVIHCECREHEMNEVIATLESLQMDYIMSAASKAKLRWYTNMRSREYFKGVPPNDLYQILTAFDKPVAASTAIWRPRPRWPASARPAACTGCIPSRSAGSPGTLHTSGAGAKP